MQPWHYIVACAVLVGIIGLVFKLAYDGIKAKDKPVNGSVVDLAPVVTGITNMNTSILKLTEVTSETKGTLGQLCKRVDEFKEEFGIQKEHCNGKFELLFKKTEKISAMENAINTHKAHSKKKLNIA